MNEEIKRVTGLIVVEVTNSNPNGDPDRESDPRQRDDRRGEISPVSFKRKLRDLVEDKKCSVWKQIEEDLKINNENFDILESRGRNREQIKKEIEEKKFIGKYWDARIFGNTFLEKEMKKDSIKTGVVQFGMGVSIAPIEVERITYTNKAGVEGDKEQGMAPLSYRIVVHGVYCIPFFVNPNYAHKSGCTKIDIDLLSKLIPFAYSHNRSAIRPSVEIRHAWYCEHKNPLGSCSDFEIIGALTPKKKENIEEPSSSWDDYNVPIKLPESLRSKLQSCIDLVSF
jgi:Cas7 group CRISPR-associated protein Csh2